MQAAEAVFAVAAGFGLGKQPVVAIDPEGPGFQRSGDSASAAMIGRIDAGGEAVACRVGADDRCLFLRESFDHDNRAEQFFLYQPMGIVRNFEERRRYDIAARVAVADFAVEQGGSRLPDGCKRSFGMPAVPRLACIY